MVLFVWCLFLFLVIWSFSSDDFVDSTPPPSKKQKKIDIKECTQKEKKKDENVTSFHNAEMKKATANAKRCVINDTLQCVVKNLK